MAPLLKPSLAIAVATPVFDHVPPNPDQAHHQLKEQLKALLKEQPKEQPRDESKLQQQHPEPQDDPFGHAGIVMSPTATMTGPRGIVMSPTATMTGPGGIVMSPTATMTGPGGIVMSPTATMTGPACIVMSPTATQSGHHVFSFPFDAPSTLRPQSTSSATSSTTLIHVSTSAASSTTVTQNLHFASLQETAVEVTSSGSSHQDTYVKSGHPSRSNNASEQENGSSASTHLDIYSGGQEGRHGRCLSVETELPPSCNGSRRGSAQLSRPIEVKETLNASVTKTAHGKMVGQYVLKRVLGQGAYGIVHLGYNVEDHDNFAIKEFSKSKLRKKKGRANLFKLGPGRRRGPAATTDDSNAPLELIRGEIAILKKLNHDNIVKLYEVLDASAEDSMFMVMEWCEKGVLTEVSLSDKPSEIFEDAECRDVFKQMVLGIEYLHEHDIIHRDIKPDNLLRSEDGTLKIVDFGVSKIFNKKGDDSTTQGAGSPAFMAPELGGYDRKHISGRAADVWSMGVTLYCIRYGKLPFRPTTTMNLQTVIQKAEPDLSSEKDPRFKTLMSRLLQKNPSERITIDQLRVDPWLTDNGREGLISKEENTQNAVTDVTDDDLEKAFKPINSLLAMLKAKSKFRQLRLRSPSPAPRSMPQDYEDNVPESVTASTVASDDENSSDHVISTKVSLPSMSSSSIVINEYSAEEKIETEIPPIRIVSVASSEFQSTSEGQEQERANKGDPLTIPLVISSAAGESVTTTSTLEPSNEKGIVIVTSETLKTSSVVSVMEHGTPGMVDLTTICAVEFEERREETVHVRTDPDDGQMVCDFETGICA